MIRSKLKDFIIYILYNCFYAVNIKTFWVGINMSCSPFYMDFQSTVFLKNGIWSVQARRVTSLTFTLYSPSINHACSTQQAGQMNAASCTQTNSTQHCSVCKMLVHLKWEIKEI